MATSRFKDIAVEGVVTQTEAAEQADELVRKGEMDALVSGLPAAGHAHVLADVTDFDAQHAGKLRLTILDSTSLAWAVTGTNISGVVQLGAEGGLTLGEAGIVIDFGTGANQAARGNHTHVQLHSAVTAADSQSIRIRLNGQDLGLEVNLLADGGLQIVPGGFSAEYTLADTAAGEAFADGECATVGILSDPPTSIRCQYLDADGNDLADDLQAIEAGDIVHFYQQDDPSVSLWFTVGSIEDEPGNNAVLINLNLSEGIYSSGALTVGERMVFTVMTTGPSGLGLIFGTGANEAARGNHTHASEHDPVTVSLSPSLSGTISAGQVLAMHLRENDSPGVNRAPVRVGVTGSYVPLGPGINEAAAGPHVHDVATVSDDGFMSAGDKALLGALTSGVGESICSFTRHDGKVHVNEYVGGRVSFGMAVRLTEINLTGLAPVLRQRFTLERGGVQTDQHVWLSGVAGVETTVTQDMAYDVPLSGPRTLGLRWICTSGVQAVDVDYCSRLTLNMAVRP